MRRGFNRPQRRREEESMARQLLTTALISLTLAAVACGEDDGGDGASPGPTTEAEPAPTPGYGAAGAADDGGEDDGSAAHPGTELTTADSQFGEALFDGERRAIYYFDRETSERSECYGACAAAWPPVLTDGEPVAEGGAETSLLGTTKRDDGSTQVTYDGRPLYYYVDDPPGEILCHDAEEFGGVWLAVQPDGEPF